MRNSKNMIKDSLDRQIDPSEAVEIHVPDVIPEIQIIEPHELHVGKNPDYRRKTQRDIWDSQYRLPDTYGSTEIVLMVRDPYWVYAYWEIADDIPRAVTAALGPEGLRTFRKALRVHDVTDIEFDGSNSHKYISIDVHDNADNWYINVERPNRSYCAELGFINKEGAFVCLSKSNTVRTPRAGVSEIVDTEWMTISEIEKYCPFHSGAPASPEIISQIAERMHLDAGSEFMGKGPKQNRRANPYK
ncbi:MAG: DUF4912 domain-containing protein [Firmicutes bacterium]|nr:DUF4912 domain-containing protein [Bacillota bacterium]